MEMLNQAGALITLCLGIAGLLAPRPVARLVSIEPIGALGKSEVRATYGGFFLALGLACFLIDAPQLYDGLGIAWLGAAAGRMVSMAVERKVCLKNSLGLLFEAAIGAACLA